MRAVLDICRSLARRARHPHKAYRRLVSLIPMSNSELSSFVEDRKFFFIVSTGRTGSAWLSRLLNTAKGAFVEHEPVLWEQAAHLEAINDPLAAEHYVRDFRLKHMYLRWRSGPKPEAVTIGEVNSAVRRHVEALQNHLPGVQFVHVVRDGRDFVRSIMSRGTYSGMHPVYRDFVPPAVDEYSERWASLTEFEKCCWVWQWSNKDLRGIIGKTVRFEDLLSSYAILSESVLQPLEIDVPEGTWRDSVAKPTNTTSKHSMGKWKTWTDEQRHTFCAICEDEMRMYDYPLQAEHV